MQKLLLTLVVTTMVSSVQAAEPLNLLCKYTRGTTTNHMERPSSSKGDIPLSAMVVTLTETSDGYAATISTKLGGKTFTNPVAVKISGASKSLQLIEQPGMGVTVHGISLTPAANDRLPLTMAKNFGSYVAVADGWCEFIPD